MLTAMMVHPSRPQTPAERFKAAEREYRTVLDLARPIIMRLDGRAFHTFTRGFARPYDERFMAAMDATAVALASSIDGVSVAYVQSDEISLLLDSHLGRPEVTPMFGGQVQKLVSIAAAMATAHFNAHISAESLALFDARAFNVAGLPEAQAYFAWRQTDARRNALSMLAAAHFNHRQLLSKSGAEREAMLREVGVEPDELPPGFRNGRVVSMMQRPSTTTFTRRGVEETVSFVRDVRVTAPAPSFSEVGLSQYVTGPRAY